MLSKDILDQIYNGSITSRRQVYGILGRSKRLRAWMDENNILVPKKWTDQMVLDTIKARYSDTGRIPRAADDWNLTERAQDHFGSWNEALYQAIGILNQHRYDHLSNLDLLNVIRTYASKYQTLPLRIEFNGKEYPDYETYLRRFQVKTWAEVIGFVNLDGIKIFPRKDGRGKRFLYDGIYYLSHQEYLIGKWLSDNGIVFLKEVPYGNTNHIFDFYLPKFDLYIEYYGLATDEYRMVIEEKKTHYNGRQVLEIFKHDNTVKKLALEVQRLQSLGADCGVKV